LAGRDEKGKRAMLSFWQGKIDSYLNIFGADLRELSVSLI
jgi:hypothetical protein